MCVGFYLQLLGNNERTAAESFCCLLPDGSEVTDENSGLKR